MRSRMDDDWYGKELSKERLHDAASSGDIERIKVLLDEGLPINAFDGLNRTPLRSMRVLCGIPASGTVTWSCE